MPPSASRGDLGPIAATDGLRFERIAALRPDLIIGVSVGQAYLRDHYPRTRDQRVIISLGGFSAEEFVTLVDRVNARVPAGDIAAVELDVSCHNVNFDFSTILQDVLADAVPRSNHPVILKLSPDNDYLRNAEQAARAGCRR